MYKMNRILILGQEFVIMGKICRVIRLRQEWDEDILDPKKIIDELKGKKIRADLFTFAQRLPNTEANYPYPMEWDNIAAIPISTYENWWTNQAFKQVRKNVRRSERRGVVVKVVEFNDDLVRGIQQIYDETRIRQGTLNTHYGKSFEETKRANMTYLERSDFIGAFMQDELIGFIKLVYTKDKVFARTIAIEGKIRYRGIGYMHALIAKAVEMCAAKHVPYLVYGKFIYGKKGSDSLTMFKQYNGFRKVNLPRYYIPLNLKGKILFSLGLHKNLNEILPRFIIRTLLKIRKLYYETRYWKDFKVERELSKTKED